MRSKTIFVVSMAFAASALVCPQLTFAQDSTNGSQVDSSATPRGAQREAAQMVPAQAFLDNSIDAKKMRPGEQFRATLRQTVQLKNGTELPRDTVLVGTIATDQMRAGGTSTLALRFTKAQLKSGKLIPIQADIMGITGPPEDAPDSNIPSYNLTPWNGTTLRVDEPGAMSGFDFHGSIGAENSALFVSKKKDEVKLSAGSLISLAIAVQNA